MDKEGKKGEKGYPGTTWGWCFKTNSKSLSVTYTYWKQYSQQ